MPPHTDDIHVAFVLYTLHIYAASNRGADQTLQMGRLICPFIDCIGEKQALLRQGFKMNLSIFPLPGLSPRGAVQSTYYTIYLVREIP